jgi:two-component system KDP operon response regulator KdpE
MMNVKVLVIAIDPGTQRLLACSLPKANFQVRGAMYDTAIEALAREQPDIVLLEQPDLCASIRLRWPSLPMIVLLDAVSQKRAIPHILDAGADDCVLKPFGAAELEARIHALVRRAEQRTGRAEAIPDQITSKDGYICLSISDQSVFVGGNQVSLTRTEFDLLRELMVHEERVLTYRTLLQRVWGAGYGDEDHYVRVYIRHLRCKVEPDPAQPRYILTEVGVGYVFRSPSIHIPHSASQKYAVR